MNQRDIRQRLAATVYRTLYWGRNHLPVGVRSLVGVCLMAGGAFGFLPVLGFWMIPAGAAFIALDLPRTRHRIDAWMLRLALQGKLDRPGAHPTRKPTDQSGEPPTSSQ